MTLRPLLMLALLGAAASAFAQPCPDKTLMYWQAFPPGGESDLSARHQQLVLKKKCPAVETVVQYKAGAGGGLMWSSMNTLPADGTQIVGINLPHIVLQPIEGQVTYKTEDVTPVYWFHYTPDAIIVNADSPFRTFADLAKAAREKPESVSLAGSGTNSANHLAHERLDREMGIRTLYVPFKGTGELVSAVLGNHVSGAMSYSTLAIQQKGKMRMLAVATEKRLPQFPDVPTFRELGLNWVDGAYRGIGVPKSTPPDVRRQVSDMMDAINKDPELRRRMTEGGFEVTDIGLEQIPAFVKERSVEYLNAAKGLGMVK